MGYGGARRGAGRPKGSVNRVTAATQAAVAASGVTPLEYMLEAMRSAAGTPRADDMAKAAAPYVHAKLAAVDATLSANVDGSITFTWLPADAPPALADGTSSDVIP